MSYFERFLLVTSSVATGLVLYQLAKKWWRRRTSPHPRRLPRSLARLVPGSIIAAEGRGVLNGAAVVIVRTQEETLIMAYEEETAPVRVTVQRLRSTTASAVTFWIPPRANFRTDLQQTGVPPSGRRPPVADEEPPRRKKIKNHRNPFKCLTNKKQ